MAQPLHEVYIPATEDKARAEAQAPCTASKNQVTGLFIIRVTVFSSWALRVRLNQGVERFPLRP